ncbi:hypothetical protein NPIL_448271 [Nephila pilipes]|uniref:MULE transposase domain-containing protein n=1 Tax=Nephila pilipes TaxID=299642 RepID=A0A8X6JZX6_NEPPI|nr:hypothetical protein NPIL_448271 [Nephila pilipes]
MTPYAWTSHMDAYRFYMAAVLDDKRQEFPATFILNNLQDSKVSSLAFVAIKEHASISPKVLMTDDAEYLYNAWRTAFGIPE